MNLVFLAGRLGADPEVKFTQGGTAVCNARIVTTKRWFDKNKNEQQEKAEWHTLTIWGKSGEAVGKHFQKGDQIIITGEIQTEQWEDKDGNKRYATKIVVDQWEFGAKVGGGQSDNSRDNRSNNSNRGNDNRRNNYGNNRNRGNQRGGYRDNPGAGEDFGDGGESFGDDDIPF